ncbi:MAG: hypothetical protein EOM23_08635, partial [Candidatus Moranbacteria bacterium]|nr:hypothetical protein [Candidatus Moranbacteria bacterium]
MKDAFKNIFLGDLAVNKQRKKVPVLQKSPEFLEWIQESYVDDIEMFIKENGLDEDFFLNKLNSVFETRKFSLYIRRWMVDYGLQILELMDDCSKKRVPVRLDTDPFHKFLFQKFCKKFKFDSSVIWIQKPFWAKRAFIIVCDFFLMLFLAFKNGLSIQKKRPYYKVLKEAVFGLRAGSLFRDDYFADQNDLKSEEILFVTRSDNKDSGRRRALAEAQRNNFHLVELSRLKFPAHELKRFFQKYLLGSFKAIKGSWQSDFFVIFQNMYVS